LGTYYKCPGGAAHRPWNGLLALGEVLAKFRGWAKFAETRRTRVTNVAAQELKATNAALTKACLQKREEERKMGKYPSAEFLRLTYLIEDLTQQVRKLRSLTGRDF